MCLTTSENYVSSRTLVHAHLNCNLPASVNFTLITDQGLRQRLSFNTITWMCFKRIFPENDENHADLRHAQQQKLAAGFLLVNAILSIAYKAALRFNPFFLLISFLALKTSLLKWKLYLKKTGGDRDKRETVKKFYDIIRIRSRPWPVWVIAKLSTWRIHVILHCG